MISFIMGVNLMKIKGIEVNEKKYPMMALHAKEIQPFTGTLVGKDKAIEGLFATYDDPIVSNAVLLAPPGTGKTTLMKGMAHKDKNHVYLEAELSEMITGLRDNAEMGSVVKNLFNEIAEFGKANNVKLVIFIDEFHQLVDYSPVVAEAFKPVLAESGVKGLRLIVATTYEEFRKKIMWNQALTERLQIISLPQPTYNDVIESLNSLAKSQNIIVDKKLRALFDTIYHTTEEFMPSASQPRKSILTFSRMIGYHRSLRKPLNFDLLAYALRNSKNIEIDMKVDLDAMEKYLRSHIFDQDEAIDSFMYSISKSILKMNESGKPRGSWLLAGSTGVGKTELVKQASSFLFNDKNAFIRFDMTEYVNADSVDRFRKLLTARVWEYPFSIILFDEIEKANGSVVRLLMQVLDDGRLVDENDRVVSFSNAYIFGTSNLGSEIFESSAHYGSESRSFDKNVRKSITDTSDGSFPPELVNRFGTILPFKPLQPNTMVTLIKDKFSKIANKFYRQHGVEVYTDGIVINNYLGGDLISKDTSSGAGRQVNRILDDYVTMPVSTYIYKNPGVRKLHLVLEGITKTGNKDVLDSTAKIVILTDDEFRLRQNRR